MPRRNRPKYVILGGGISGLSLAFFLKKASPDCQITLIEKEASLGGWLQTEQHDSFLFEKGPHSLRLAYPFREVCEDLFNDLGLYPEIIHPSTNAKVRFIAHSKKLHPLKLGPLMLLNPLNFTKISLPLIKDLLSPMQVPTKDQSIYDFFHKKIGSYLTRQLLDPLVMGIMGGDIHSLSYKASFPALDRICEGRRSLLTAFMKHQRKHPSSMISFKQGFGQLVQALEMKTEALFLKNEKVLRIQDSSSPLVTTDQQTIACDHIFSTLPAYALKPLLSGLSKASVSFLASISYIPYKMAHIGYTDLQKLPPAFGFIAPSWSQEALSGVIFDSQIFPDHNQNSSQTRLSAMIHPSSPLFTLSKKELKARILDQLQSLLGIKKPPCYFKIITLDQAIPQYKVGHLEKVALLKKELTEKKASLTFLGNSFYGVSVPSCIYHAFLAAKQIETVNLKI